MERKRGDKINVETHAVVSDLERKIKSICGVEEQKGQQPKECPSLEEVHFGKFQSREQPSLFSQEYSRTIEDACIEENAFEARKN